MECTKCHFENPEGMSFCGGCGEKLQKICTRCNSENPSHFKFCGQCGHDLTHVLEPPRKELSFDEKLQKIQKYLPGGLTEKILSQRGKIEGEHRQVTVLFADMENFTPLVEKLGPEEAYSIMDQVYEILIHKVHDFEGTVNEMTGDGVMALFGAPIALEDAPQRAIRSALAIHQQIARFSERMRQEKGIPPVRMRIGIHTGPVVVGTLGNDLRVEFKAVGDTVNLASRIQNLAAAGTTYVSGNTFNLTEGLFRFESLGPREIKGKEEPVTVYQVIAPSSRRTRFDVNAERGLTPFVGRARELENLLDGLDRAKSGRGQAFSLIGEAGVGKSRLLYEFRKAVANEDITFLEGKCLSYGRGSAYHPIIDILKATFNIHETDADHQIREKVADGLKKFKIDESSGLPYLLELLSVKDSGMDKISISPEGKKDRIIEVLKQISLRGSEIRPLIMAIEDLHWVDKSTEDALKYILEVIPGARIVLIFTYRPEYAHTWGRKSYHNQLMLNRLSNKESLAMAANLLNTGQIDRDLEDLILSRAEGIPFFIEEHIKALKDLKIIERQNGTYRLTKDFKTITIPSTIQDVIMARVDALPEGAKEIIRTGSVIEREFSHELLNKVTALSEQELLSSLSILKDSELIYERGIYPDSTYIFKHALTREVVYESILTKKRRELHQKIANAMEDIHRNDICYHYGILAGHCISGEYFEKGAEYARLEAKRYEKAGSYKDAVSYVKQCIACLERLTQSEHILKKIIDARTMLSTNFSFLGYHIEAKEAVEPIVELAVRLDYQKRIPRIYNAIGLYHIAVEEDFAKGVSYLKDAFEKALVVGDFLALWFGNFMLGSTMLWTLNLKESFEYIKTSLDLSVAANNLSAIASSKSYLAINYFLQGKAGMALQTIKEALQAAESEDPVAKQNAYGSYGTICYYMGNLSEAEKYLQMALANFDKAPQLEGGWVAAHLGWLYHDVGEFHKAKEYIQQSHSILENARIIPSFRNLFELIVIINEIMIGGASIDINRLEDLIHAHEKCKLPMPESFGFRFICEIFLNLDNQYMSEAEMWIKRSIDFDTNHAIPWYMGKDYILYADWFKKKGDVLKTREQLSKAIDLFRVCGADGWIDTCEKKLALFS